MSLISKLMRIFTPAQPAAATATPGMRVARNGSAEPSPSARRAVSSSGSVAVAPSKPSSAMPTAPERPVEVMSPSRRPTPTKGAPAVAPKPALEPSGPQIGEVVDLIHKLRNHVDAQNSRFEKAMSVLDNIRGSAAALPEIKQRVDGVLASMDELRDSVGAGQARMERALADHGARLDAISEAIHRASEREERLAQSMLDIGQTIKAVSGTNDRLAQAIETMRRHEADRDARLGRALLGAQRWLMALTIVMSLGMAGTLVAAIAIVAS
ncbi:MAG: hypothetical protein AAFX79_06230 [Planctomycetota bacterium]